MVADVQHDLGQHLLMREQERLPVPVGCQVDALAAAGAAHHRRLIMHEIRPPFGDDLPRGKLSLRDRRYAVSFAKHALTVSTSLRKPFKRHFW